MENNKTNQGAGGNDNANRTEDQDYITLDMPEVKDIPGQEHVKVPNIREMQDTTISSADEEGEGVLDDLNTEEEDDDNNADVTGSDVSNQEKELLKKSIAHQRNGESWDVEGITLDEKDDDGELLNEQSIRNSLSGEDLDVPGADLDDDNENIGEEDEENNMYSQSQRDDQ